MKYVSMKPEPPEVIRGWRNSQLSIARHYGGITYNGAKYLIDENDDLVRADVLKARAKAAKKTASKSGDGGAG